jgi:hypothetical protein
MKTINTVVGSVLWAAAVAFAANEPDSLMAIAVFLAGAVFFVFECSIEAEDRRSHLEEISAAGATVLFSIFGGLGVCVAVVFAAGGWSLNFNPSPDVVLAGMFDAVLAICGALIVPKRPFLDTCAALQRLWQKRQT